MAVNYCFFDAVESGGVYDREYSSENFSNWLDKIVGTGVFADPSTNLQVTAVSGMNIKVKAGSAWIYGHKMDVDADYSLTVSAADVALPRKDYVIAYCDWTNRDMGIEIHAGTPAATPQPPVLSLGKGTRYELALAEIYVASQTTTITQSNITDNRGGAFCPYVAGLITQLDTATLFAQWQDAFDSWFTSVQQTVWDANFIQRAEGHGHISAGTSTINVEALWVPSFVYGTDILEIYFNGLRLTPTIDYTVAHNSSGTIVTFTSPPEGYVDIAVVALQPRQLS